VSACFALLKIKKPNLTISATPSFFASFVSIFNKNLRGGKLILDITDVWPDSAIATGFMKKGFLFFFAKKIEQWIYRQADHITCGSLGTKKELLKNKNLLNKIEVIPDAIDANIFSSITEEEGITNKFNLNNKFVVGFTGLMGFAQNVKMLALVAEKLINYKDIVFLLVGDGGMKEGAEAFCKKNNLVNVVFVGEKPYSEMPKYIKCFDIGLVTLKNEPLFENSVPSKLFHY